MMLYSVVALLTVAVASVHCNPTGAPSGACASITPQPGHGGSSQDLNGVPFALNLTAFASNQYKGDQTYNRK